MFDPRHLEALSAVVRTGSFDAAAAALSVTPSAVSQRIRALEEQVGAVLVVRVQPVRATLTGARLLRHAEDVDRLAQEVMRDLGLSDGTRARLRIAVNADSLATWFMDALPEAGDAFFDIVVDDEGHSAELLRRGEVAAAVTSEGMPVQGCDAVRLGALRFLPICAPSFRERWFAGGVTAEELAAAPVLTINEKDALQLRWAEAVAGRRLRLAGHRMATPGAFLQAALLGLGWGMNPEPLVKDHVAEGRLIVLPPGTPLDTPLVWQASRIGRGALAPLTAAVRRAARKALVAA
jgi:LysR family transcriptional regulator (chromosome initiation inhibitor)